MGRGSGRGDGLLLCCCYSPGWMAGLEFKHLLPECGIKGVGCGAWFLFFCLGFFVFVALGV